jgi:hypothetical protein
MAASITTASNVIIVGTSIIVPVDIQSSAIAYDTFNNAWIVEGTVEANIQNGTLYVDVVNTPTVLATIEGQPISVNVANTPTVLATIEGQPISVTVSNTPTVLATIEGQPISVNVSNTPSVNVANTPTVLATIEGQPISVNVANTPTVLATIEGQPISVNVANTPSVNVANTPTVLATIEGQPISVNVTSGTVNTVAQPNATLLGQVVNGSITANANIFSSNLSITQPSSVFTVVAAGASGTLSMSLTVGTTTVQNYLNSGNPLNANSWYEFAINLPSGVQINYQYTSSTTVTILVLSEPL